MLLPNKWLAAAVLLPLFYLYNWNEAHAAAGPLEKIDGRLVSENFPLEKAAGFSEGQDGVVDIPGCAHTRTFEVSENGAPGRIIVALCSEGVFGPRNIEASVAKQVKEAEERLKGLPAPLADLMRSGIEAIDIPLDAGSRGKALTVPVVGHGFMMMPFAYSIMPGKDTTLVVQALLDPNKPRNLSSSIAVLLKAVSKRVLQAP